jgi:DNA-3-methyladenine glycosylase II
LTAAAKLDAPLVAAAVDRLRFFLSFDDNLHAFYAYAEQDPWFRPVVARLYGLHQVKFPTPFENAVWAILTQRTPMAVARKIKDRLVHSYGPNVEIAGQVLHSFPSPYEIAGLSLDQLVALIGNQVKAQRILDVATGFASVDESFLRTGPYDDVANWLRSLNGIGEWSTSFIMIRGLGRVERLLSYELELQRSFQRIYGNSLSMQTVAACALGIAASRASCMVLRSARDPGAFLAFTGNAESGARQAAAMRKWASGFFMLSF